jgi:glycosyltransferase involved in cell wall biosynthesis
MDKRVLAILEAGNAYPSGVVRALQYKEHLNAAGCETRFVGRLSPFLVRCGVSSRPLIRYFLACGGRKIVALLQRAYTFANEFRLVRMARQHEVIYLSKVQSLTLLEKLRKLEGKRLVFDFGDAIWLPRYQMPHFHDMLKLPDVVTTDNPVTAEFVKKYNKNCIVIPDCPQLEEFDKIRDIPRERSRRLVIGWIGTPGTAYNLFAIWEALEVLFTERPDLHLRLVGTGTQAALLPPFERVDFSVRKSYSQREMIEEVLRMDIGLFPLQNVEASRVRGVLKAAIYMAGQVPVVSSPVGECTELIRDGVNGFLAGQTSEWVDKIGRLINDSDLRETMGRNGLATARQRFRTEDAFSLLHAAMFPGNETAAIEKESLS